MTAVAIEATPSRARSWWLLPTLAAVATAAGVWWSLAPYVVGVFHDDGIYALLARSVAAGQGLHYSHLPGAPAATHYPPLYPLLLAALWRVAPEFPSNVGMLLGVNALLAGMAALGHARFASVRLAWRPGAAAVVAAVVMMTTPMLTLAGALLSETMFVALLWPSLLLGERLVDEPGPRDAALTGAMVGVLMLVRTHAVALLLALVVLLAVRKAYRVALISCAAAIAVQLPWLLWTHFATPHVAAPLEGSYGSYLGWFVMGLREGGAGFVLDTARINVRELALLLRDRFTTGVAPVDGVVLALVIGAMLTGAGSFARRAPVTLAFLVIYLGIVVVWPYSPWRFAWAVWPVAVTLQAEGIRTIWMRNARWRLIGGVVATLPALAILRTELHSYATRAWRAPARQAAAQVLPVLAWTRDNTAPGDVLLAEGEQVIALYTGRRAAPPVAFTALEYVRPSAASVAASLHAMLRAVPATRLVTMSPDVHRAAIALRDPVIALAPIPAPASAAAFMVSR